LGGLVGGGGGSVGCGGLVGGAGVLVGFGVWVGFGVSVGGTGVSVGGTSVFVGGGAVGVGGAGVLVDTSTLVGTAVLIDVEVGWIAVGSGAPATGDLTGSGMLLGANFVGTGVATAAGLVLEDWLSLCCPPSPLLPVTLGLSADAVAGLAVLPGPAAAGALVVLALGDEPPVVAGLALGSVVDSAASSAPLSNGAGVAGINSVAVGRSAAASVGSSMSWLASPDCSAFGSNPGSSSEPPDAPEEPPNPRSGAYGPAAKFEMLGENSSNSPSVTNMTARQVPTIIPIRTLGRTARSFL
jgi:hypothetical protein